MHALYYDQSYLIWEACGAILRQMAILAVRGDAGTRVGGVFGVKPVGTLERI
jgi:hypothetical protein